MLPQYAHNGQAGPLETHTTFRHTSPVSDDDDNDNLLSMNISMLQQHAHCAWAITIIKLIIFVAYGSRWVCLCCHNPPNSNMDYRIFIVRTDVNACNCTQGLQTPKESLQWKLTLGRKFLATRGDLTGISGVTVRCSNQLSYIPSHPSVHKYKVLHGHGQFASSIVYIDDVIFPCLQRPWWKARQFIPHMHFFFFFFSWRSACKH